MQLQTATLLLQQGIETRREKTDCWLFFSKQTLRQPRNEVTDWSIAQLLTDNWLVCGKISSNKKSHASQPTANNSKPSGNLSNKTFKDILRKETAVNSLKGNEFKAILPDLKKFFQMFLFYLQIVSSYSGFNWLIKLPWQLRCPQTKQKSQQTLIFSSRAYALVSPGLWLYHSRG